MTDTARIRLQSPKFTHSCGGSLAATLYTGNITVVLRGELGAGKTTFLQGFAEGLGIEHPITSPTYALEQRYPLPGTRELLHMDLYRLTTTEASQLVAATDDCEGTRVIEWADRLKSPPAGPRIEIDIKEIESGESRELTVIFSDIPLPFRKEILAWRRDVRLPEHIAKHCDAVAKVTESLGTALLKRCILLRPLALKRAAEVHDLLRFVDFRGASHVQTANDTVSFETWNKLRERYSGLRHEAACAALLREKGFDALATIVSTHGVRLPPEKRATIEQKILFYADKRVAFDRIVTLEERFEDFATRYGNGTQTEESRAWYEEAMRVEKELFPEGAPL